MVMICVYHNYLICVLFGRGRGGGVVRLTFMIMHRFSFFCMQEREGAIIPCQKLGFEREWVLLHEFGRGGG